MISTFGCALAQGVESFFLFRVLSGAFAGPIMPNCLAYAGDALQGNRRNRALTNIMLGFTLASILGVPVGSALAEWVSWRWTFGVIGLGGLLSLLWLTSIPSIATGAEQITIRRQYLQMFGLWKRQEVRWVFAMQFFMLIGLFGFIPHMSIWLTTNYGLSASAIGLLYMQEGIVLTMFDQRNNLSLQVEQDARDNLGELVFQVKIPRNVRLSEAPSFSMPVLQYDSLSKGAMAYRALTQEFLKNNLPTASVKEV